MAEQRCDFSDLPVSQCAHCREQRHGWPHERVRDLIASRGIFQCPTCSGPSDGPGQCRRCLAHPMYRWEPRPLSAAEVQRWVATRYLSRPDQVTRWRYLNDPEYHARVKMWEQIMRSAFGPEEDWEAIAETASVLELGPWITPQWRGICRGCGGRWEEGEQIRFSEDEGGWICFGCGCADP